MILVVALTGPSVIVSADCMSEIPKTRIIMNWLQEAGWVLFILLLSPFNFFLKRLVRTGRRKQPIVLVCDFFTNPLVYIRLAGHLQQAGFPVHTLATGTIFRGLRQHARFLGKYLEKENLKDVIIIGHGSGSLVALSMPDAPRQRIHHLLTLAAPFNGTRLLLPFWFIPGLNDMTVGSEYLLLNRMNSLLFALFTPCCAWQDETIVPFNLARFGQGRDLIFDRVGHFNLVLATENLHTLVEILNETYPDPASALEQARLSGVGPVPNTSRAQQGTAAKIIASNTSSASQKKRKTAHSSGHSKKVHKNTSRKKNQRR